MTTERPTPLDIGVTPALSPQAMRSLVVCIPVGLLLWALIIKAIDFLRWAVFAAAGALFVVTIAAAMTAACYWAIDLF